MGLAPSNCLLLQLRSGHALSHHVRGFTTLCTACVTDGPTSVSPSANPALSETAAEAVVYSGEYDFEYNFIAPPGYWPSFYGWIPTTEYLVLPPGDYELEIKVTGGITLSLKPGYFACCGFAWMNNRFIGPGGADPGEDIYYGPGRFFPVSVEQVKRQGGRDVYRPVWTAPPNDDPVASATIRVSGGATYRFVRSYGAADWAYAWTMLGVNKIWNVNANQRGRLTARRIDANLKLTCVGDLGPNRVTRGQEIVCTAGKNPGSAPGDVSVSGWSFEGTARTDGDPTSREWRGIMVKSGTVEVRGKVGSGPEQPASAAIEVVDRTWSDSPVMHLLELPAFGGEARVDPLAEKISWASDLGEFTPFSEPPPGEQLPDVIQVVDGGPNDGLHYFADLSFPVWARIRINLAAMTEGSGFYRAQERSSSSNGARVGGASWCSNRVVSSVLPDLVRTHEGLHVEVYRERFRAVVGPSIAELEQLTGSYGDLADRYDPLRTRADVQATAASKAIDAPGSPDRLRFRENGRECNLKNEDGDVLTNKPENTGS